MFLTYKSNYATATLETLRRLSPAKFFLEFSVRNIWRETLPVNPGDVDL